MKAVQLPSAVLQSPYQGAFIKSEHLGVAVEINNILKIMIGQKQSGSGNQIRVPLREHILHLIRDLASAVDCRQDIDTRFFQLFTAVQGNIPDYGAWRDEVYPLNAVQTPVWAKENAVNASFYIRMLFSRLTDADFLDTEAFISGEKRESVCVGFADLDRRLEHYIAPWLPPKD